MADTSPAFNGSVGQAFSTGVDKLVGLPKLPPTGQEVAQTKPATPTPTNQPTPSKTDTTQPTTPTTGAGMDPAFFSSLLGQVGDTLKYNNQLVSTRQLLLKGLYDSALTPDELGKLPKDIQYIVNSGDKNAIELQVRVLNDQLQGRAQTLDKSISAITTGYEASQKNAKDAMVEILNYAQSTGKSIADVAKALAPIYGVDLTNKMLSNLETLGGTLLKTNQVAPSTSGLTYSVTIPDGTIASKTNNPFNIKYSPTSGLGGTDSGIAGQDGGTFTMFSSLQEGYNAAKTLLTGSVYSGLTVDEAMKKWSNNGYGAEVAPGIIGTKKISQLSSDELDTLLSGMAKRESGASITGSLKLSDELKGLLNIYKTTGVIPPMGLSGKGMREQFYAAVGAGGQDIVSIAALNKARISGLNKALGTQENQYAATNTSLGTLDKQLNLVEEYSKKVDRTGTPIANKYLLWLKGDVQGDADTKAFENIVTTASNEFAKILSGSSASIAGVTVSSAAEAKNLLNASQTPEQLAEVIKVMRQEGQYRLDSQKESIQTIKDDFKGEGDITTDTSTSGIPKGSMSSKDYVEKVLTSNKINYNDFISKVPTGKIPVIQNSDGTIGYLDSESELTSDYTRI